MSGTSGRDDFYVGYQAKAPTGLSRFLRRAVVLLAIGGAGLGAILVALQAPFDPGAFEFGVVRDYEGLLAEHPAPMLRVETPIAVGDARTSDFLLVAFGKRGAAEQVAGLDGRKVRLRGALIHRQGQAMLELAGEIEELAPAQRSPSPEIVALGRHTFRGEIVDSKCFLGVMKPGRGKPHRACATRCISGGVPPLLRVETESGEFRDILLTDEHGDAVNDRVLEFVAEPVEVTGELERRRDLLILAADPDAIRRL